MRKLIFLIVLTLTTIVSCTTKDTSTIQPDNSFTLYNEAYTTDTLILLNPKYGTAQFKGVDFPIFTNLKGDSIFVIKVSDNIEYRRFIPLRSYKRMLQLQNKDNIITHKTE